MKPKKNPKPKSPPKDALVPDPNGHPWCRLCRDGTYATVSIVSFDLLGPGHYCDPCSESLITVIRDAQGRVAEVVKLPAPPALKATAPKALVPVPADKEAVKTSLPNPLMTALLEVEEGNDLMTLLGLR